MQLHSSHHDWRATGAYLYVLHLTPPELAWEYLRRNPDYRDDCDRHVRGEAASATRWGLIAFEDPHVDARWARPSWNEDEAEALRVVPLPASHTATRFSLWSLSGRKTLLRERRTLSLVVDRERSHLRVALDPRLTSD